MIRLALLLAFALSLAAAGHSGAVTFGGLPVPGATVTASRPGAEPRRTITGLDGAYGFPDLPDGRWTLRVEMQLFAPQTREIDTSSPPATWELEAAPTQPPAQSPFERIESKPTPPPDPELAKKAADGLLINGSINNGNATPFAQLPAFGNNRRGQRSLYNGSLGLLLNHSALDARSYSVTGQDTPKPTYSRLQGLLAFGGPIRIPKWLPRNGPVFTVNYQWTRNATAATQSGLVPTALERAGDLSAASRAPLDPVANNQPFPNARIPANRLSPQARELLTLFPDPNFQGSSRYNFQAPLVTGFHQDDLQTRANKQVRKNYLSGNFNAQSTRTSTPSLYGFQDTGRTLGLNTAINYRRTFTPRFFLNAGAQYSRLRDTLTPYFANRRNVSAEAGVTGNNQDPANWGPPSLTFFSGISPLNDAQSALLRNQTTGLSTDAFFSRKNHNVTFGAVHRRQQFNVLSQQDPRGSFVFTGAAAGNDFAGFLLGIPDTSSIAFGNADKYLRASITESFLNDDWRVNPGFTLNYGLRWEYWSPVREKYGRLVNLDRLNGQPAPDRNNWAPRLGLSWRPFNASSLVIRAGYGIYYDTSVYQPIAMQMAQQAPLSKSLRIANSAAIPLTLAAGFPNVPSAAATFAVDPNFRIGYSQNWQLSAQRDLPAALQLTASYNGGKATRAQQQFLPNTSPTGATGPSGYTFLSSNGNATRHEGQLQLRRRLRAGFTAQAAYRYAKALDNASLGPRLLAQDWRNLRAERGRSVFDQRHMVTGMAQYTTKAKSRLLQEWTMSTQFTAGTGLPLNPVYLSAAGGTGFTGNLRPDFTGAPLYDAPPGLFLNPAALTAPPPGRWGNAGRNTINGPSQFSLNASAGRIFRPSADRFSWDVRLDASNALNTVRFPSWNTVLGSAQFGLPTTANPMRTVQLSVRTRF